MRPIGARGAGSKQAKGDQEIAQLGHGWAELAPGRMAILMETPTKRIVFIQEQRGFSVNVGGAGDGGNDFVALAAVGSRELAANDAFLNPRIALGQFTVGGK